jgi:hypothetical protein
LDGTTILLLDDIRPGLLGDIDTYDALLQQLGIIEVVVAE